jgi:hypothetical protein
LQRAGNAWCDGYEGELNAIFDEMDGQIPLNILLRLWDGHPVAAEYKGGYTYPVWTRVFVTTNYHPQHWYPRAELRSVRALLRRITTLYTFHDDRVEFVEGPIAYNESLGRVALETE